MANILLVEEDKQTILNEKRALRGHTVRSTETLEEGRGLLSKNIFDAVVCGVHFQTGSCYDLLKFVKSDPIHSSTVFVLVSFTSTLGTQESTETTAKLLGVDKFLALTTFDEGFFRHEIESLLELPDELTEAQINMAIKRERAHLAVARGRYSEGEDILRELLLEMARRRRSYDPIELATVQHELSMALELQGKHREADKIRATIVDF